MKRLLRPAAALLLLAGQVVWILTVAIQSDYNEEAVLLLGGLWFITAVALSWRTSHRASKTAIVVAAVAAMLIFGRVAIKAVGYQQQIKAIIAQNILEATARALHTLPARGVPLPDENWEGLLPVLEGLDLWPPLAMPYAGKEESIQYTHLPRKDEWGCKYAYEKHGPERFTLKSSGADRRWDTADDLIVTQDSPLAEGPRSLPVF